MATLSINGQRTQAMLTECAELVATARRYYLSEANRHLLDKELALLDTVAAPEVLKVKKKRSRAKTHRPAARESETLEAQAVDSDSERETTQSAAADSEASQPNAGAVHAPPRRRANLRSIVLRLRTFVNKLAKWQNEVSKATRPRPSRRRKRISTPLTTRDLSQI